MQGSQGKRVKMTRFSCQFFRGVWHFATQEGSRWVRLWNRSRRGAPKGGPSARRAPRLDPSQLNVMQLIRSRVAILLISIHLQDRCRYSHSYGMRTAHDILHIIATSRSTVWHFASVSVA